MALSRVKVWNPGDVLTAADQNGEFNNIINNPITLVSPTTGPINFNLQGHTNLVPTAISGTSGSVGQSLTISSSGAPTWGGAGGGGLASPSRVNNLSGFISSQSGTFTADSYVMRSTLGNQSWTVNASSSFSASVGTAGPAAGGRDQAGVFASTYVHWYAISTGPLSTAPAGLVSSNPPTVGPAALPTGYNGWTYLGVSPYLTASTTVFSDHLFKGKQMSFLNQGPQSTGNVLLNGTATVLTSVSIAAIVSPNTISYRLYALAGISAISVAGNYAASLAITSSQAAPYFTELLAAFNGPSANGMQHAYPQIIMPTTGPALWYLWNTPSTATNQLNLDVNGYTMPNGDA